MIFMDFEASGLMKGSFPIQIGWAEVMSDKTTTTDAHYIYCERWMEQTGLWDARAQDVHHITRANLKYHGDPPEVVARLANEALAGAVVCVDSPFDKLWAKMLFDQAGMDQLFLLVDIAFGFDGPEIDERAYESALKVIDKVAPRTHRADDDARHWAELYRMSLKDGALVRSMRRTRDAGEIDQK